MGIWPTDEKNKRCIPLKIWILSKAISVIDYDKEYPGRSKTINEAKGELEKFNTKDKPLKYNERCVGIKTIDGVEYDMIWASIADNWYKVISKVR